MTRDDGDPEAWTAELLRLQGRLVESAEITGPGDTAEREAEAEALALALVDIRESLRAALDEHYPRIAAADASDAELAEAIADLREELRHVVYHVHDSRFLRAVFEPGRDYSRPGGDEPAD